MATTLEVRKKGAGGLFVCWILKHRGLLFFFFNFNFTTLLIKMVRDVKWSLQPILCKSLHVKPRGHGCLILSQTIHISGQHLDDDKFSTRSATETALTTNKTNMYRSFLVTLVLRTQNSPEKSVRWETSDLDGIFQGSSQSQVSLVHRIFHLSCERLWGQTLLDLYRKMPFLV